MTNRTQLKGIFLLLVTAFIWGSAFVAQSEGGDALGAYTFNGTRFLMGGILLIPVLFLFKRRVHLNRKLLTGGISCGLALMIASNFQQVGITLGTPAGKAGFLTACYIVFVPILGLFLGKRCSFIVWLAVAITLAGLFLLCISEDFSLSFTDSLLLVCAFCFAIQILLVDHFVVDEDPLALSIIEFLTCGILTMIPAFILEIIPNPSGMMQAFCSFDAWIPLLYAAVMSTGVAYTLQIFAQRYVHPTLASLLMSLESVFAVLAGWVILGEGLTVREGIGCVLIFIAILLAQI